MSHHARISSTGCCPACPKPSSSTCACAVSNAVELAEARLTRASNKKYFDVYVGLVHKDRRVKLSTSNKQSKNNTDIIFSRHFGLLAERGQHGRSDVSVWKHWRRLNWNTYSRSFQMYPLWRAFSKSSVFGDRKRRFIVDGRPNRRKKRLRFRIYRDYC